MQPVQIGEQGWNRPEGSICRFRYTTNMAQANTFDRITVEPAKCGRKPCIRGLRITVRRVPFRIQINGLDAMPAECKAIVDRFVALVSEATGQGVAVEIVCR